MMIDAKSDRVLLFSPEFLLEFLIVNRVYKFNFNQLFKSIKKIEIYFENFSNRLFWKHFVWEVKNSEKWKGNENK